MEMKTALVTGAGGFIAGWLVGDLLSRGYRVRAVDIKPIEDWYQIFPMAESRVGDLREKWFSVIAVDGMDEVYNLACNMGGMGFIESNKAECMLSVLINAHLLQAAKVADISRYFFSSTACVYNASKQANKTTDCQLKESDAYPAMPEDGYGWEKLFSERMCRHFREDFGLETRVARFHNVYGPHGTFEGGREKVPAAICRKVIHAKLSGNLDIEIWGDGNQTRSFAYIDDCIHGISVVMDGDNPDPVNLGSSECVTINQLVDVIEETAGVKLNRYYKLDAPHGVNGRSSDNTEFRRRYGWEPSTPLRDGLERTYRWIYDQMARRYQ